MSSVKNCSDVTGHLLGIAFGQYAVSRCPDDACFVLLTEELAQHLADIYDNTNWERFIKEEPDEILDIPEEVFGEFVDREKLQVHVGEHIYLAVYGDPWSDALSAQSIPHGFGIQFMDDSLVRAVSLLEESLTSEYCGGDYVMELNKAITMMLKSGLSDKDITNTFLISLLKCKSYH